MPSEAADVAIGGARGGARGRAARLEVGRERSPGARCSRGTRRARNQLGSACGGALRCLRRVVRVRGCESGGLAARALERAARSRRAHPFPEGYGDRAGAGRRGRSSPVCIRGEHAHSGWRDAQQGRSSSIEPYDGRATMRVVAERTSKIGSTRAARFVGLLALVGGALIACGSDDGGPDGGGGAPDAAGGGNVADVANGNDGGSLVDAGASGADGRAGDGASGDGSSAVDAGVGDGASSPIADRPTRPSPISQSG